MSDAYTMVRRWIDNPKNLKTELARCNVFSHGDTIYSYGTHFAMGHLRRDAEGKPTLAILNGDTFSVSTTRHQSEVRAGVQRAEIPYLIVPFSSLDAARIDHKSIEIIATKADGYEYNFQASDTPPASMGPIDGHGSFGGRYIYKDDELTEYVGKVGGQLVALHDGQYQWYSVRHWLGDSVFKADVRASRWDDFTSRTTYFISSFDRQESRPLYFLSELPREVSSFEDALQALKPEAVVTAEEMGREVTRQGDMFAVPTAITTRKIKQMGGTLTKRQGPVREWIENDSNWESPRDYGFIPAAEVVDFAGDWSYWVEQGERGDWWAKMPRYSAMPMTAISKPKHRVETSKSTGISLYGTAHTATEVAVLPDGTMLARGSMYHQPWIVGERWRDADHARRKIGDGKAWHLIVRNTVPTQESVAAIRAA